MQRMISTHLRASVAALPELIVAPYDRARSDMFTTRRQKKSEMQGISLRELSYTAA